MARRSSVHEAFLTHIPLAVVVDHENPMKSIDINSNLKEALISLCSENAEALPVFDPKSTKDYKYVASRLDIIAMVSWSNTDGWKESPLIDVLESEEHVVDPRIFEFTMNDSVLACLDSFSKGVHHILVKNQEYQTEETKDDDLEFDSISNGFTEQKYYWLSQFEIVQFLYTNLPRMSAIVDAPINKIGLVKEEKLNEERVFTVHHKILAKEAFKQFLVHHCEAIAIVNDAGQMISHISESDIVGIGPEAINFLIKDEYLNIGDFINAVNKENNRNIGPICCKKDEILKELMKIIVERKSNHIWIVDADNRAIKLITLNDIICKFSPCDYKTNNFSKRLSLIAAGNAKEISSSSQTKKVRAESDYDFSDR